MWGRKRRDNRRGHQRYTLLNVDLPIEKVRQQRIRWAIRAIGFVLAVVALFFGVWHGGSWLLRAGFYLNDRFIVKTVDVRTDGLIKPEQIRLRAGVRKNENLFGLDLQRVKRDLEMVPQIKTAAVDRVLPDTLRLRITERLPLAQVIIFKQQSEGELTRMVYWLDANAVLMHPIDAKNTTLGSSTKWMPLIIGIDQIDLMPGRAVQSPQLESALSLISRLDLSPMAGLAHVCEIDVSGRNTLELTTWQGGRIRLALHGLDRQLKRWRQVHDLGRKHKRTIASIDLSIQNNLPVRWKLMKKASPQG